MRKAAAAVSVGTYSAWESIATLRLLGGARGAWAALGAHAGRRDPVYQYLISKKVKLFSIVIFNERYQYIYNT